jgi:hypothetical protein
VRSGGGNNADGPHGRRRSVEDPRARLYDERGRNLGAAGLAWLLILTAAITAFWVFQPILRDPLDSDLTLVFIGARIGLEHGWSHIYSLDLQHQLWEQLRQDAPFGDGERFLSPPPMAWLLAPLTALGAAGAFYAWTVLSAAALVAAWWLAAPGAGLTRWLWLLAALAWYPLLYSLSLGQPIMLIALAVAASWCLAEAGRPYFAGFVLGLSAIKPQLTLVLPAVLLVGGHWRMALGWAVTAGLLAALSILLIGGQGVSDYRSLIAEAQALTNNRYFTLAYVVGPGLLSYAAQASVTAIALVGAYLNRRASLSHLFCLGLVATALGASYWHLQDYAILVCAAWLFWRDSVPDWQRLWLLVVVLAGELAWPLSPLPILIALAVWFAFLVAPHRTHEANALAAAQ